MMQAKGHCESEYSGRFNVFGILTRTTGVVTGDSVVIAATYLGRKKERTIEINGAAQRYLKRARERE
ncbi:unnamed protein product [Urochloa humidicola]